MRSAVRVLHWQGLCPANQCMTLQQKLDRGRIELETDECKGCGLCVEACPPKVLRIAEHFNRYGLHPAVYRGSGCTACGICFFVCPEPGAITVLRITTPKAGPCRNN